MEKNFSLAVGSSSHRGVFRAMDRTNILECRLGVRTCMRLCYTACFFLDSPFDPPNFAPFPIRVAGIYLDTGFFMHFIDFYLLCRYNNIS